MSERSELQCHGPRSRSCARPGCARPAAATLSYDYRSRVAWLEPLPADPHPMTHDLCGPHANGLSVPRGWRLEDRRMVTALFASVDPSVQPAVEFAAKLPAKSLAS